ncbi:MAG: zinc-binding dehydrogenase [Bacteroidota bacterium]
MKKIQFSTYGAPEVLQLCEVKMPQPGPGQVLVKVAAAGVNFSDILRRENRYFMPTPLPYVPGSEAVGEIVSIGEGVTAPYLPVTRILAILPGGGGYAEYVLADAAYCVPLPPSISSEAATAIFVQGSTAHLMLDRIVVDVRGKSLLIHAAAGGVGSILVQLAKMAGARVIATASSAEKLAKAQEFGADAGVNYAESQWPEKVIAANQGEKVDYIFEMIGGNIYQQSFACLKSGGSMIVYGAASGQKGYIHSEAFVDENHHLLAFNLAHFIQNRTSEWQESLGAVIGLLAEGKLKIGTQDRFSLAEAALAHQQIEARKTSGKVVLIP